MRLQKAFLGAVAAFMVIMLLVGHGRTAAFERKSGALRGQLEDMDKEGGQLRAEAERLSAEITRLNAHVLVTKRSAGTAMQQHRAASSALGQWSRTCRT